MAHSDDKGLVLRFKSPHLVVLYTGAAGFSTERWLLKHCRDQLSADLWVRGSHSRDQTGSTEFVEAVQPRGIILCHNPWKKRTAPNATPPDSIALTNRTKALHQPFPSPDSQNSARHIPVFSTSECGAVLGEIQGTQFRIRGFRSPLMLEWHLPNRPRPTP